MTKHGDHEVDELTRRVRELRERIGEHEPRATALEKLWAAIDGYLGELRNLSTALAGAEGAAEAPLLAPWNSQLLLLDAAFALVEERLLDQTSARNLITLRLEAASAEMKAVKARGDELVGSVESLTADIGPCARADAELIGLLDVLSKRVTANKKSLGLLERAMVDFEKRARMLLGAGDAK